MGRSRAALLSISSLLFLATPAHAQRRPVPDAETQPRTCRQTLPSDFRRLVNARGQETLYFRDPVRVLCSGGVRLEADSAVLNRAAGTVELIGDVVYQDSTRRLEAGWANYIGRAEQLLARNAVTIEDLTEGGVITGGQLNYLRETPTRPLARLTVTGERPHAVLPPPARDGEPAADTVPATDVWADRIEVDGALFRAQGAVQLARGALRGAGAQAEFDQRTERMTLTGDSWVQSEGYRLSGDRIEALTVGGELRDVIAERAARARSDELDVRSDRILIGFEGGEVERLEAWNPETAGRVWAVARDFLLRADSLDARADSAGIEEVRAVGRAYGERRADDVERNVAEEASPAPAPALIDRDWIQGDTIFGFFARVPALEGDSTRTVLDRVEVVGGEGPALSLYRMRPEEVDGRPSIYFTTATRILLFMDEGEVARVEAQGPMEGIFLEPRSLPAEDAGQGAGSEPGSERSTSTGPAGIDAPSGLSPGR